MWPELWVLLLGGLWWLLAATCCQKKRPMKWDEKIGSRTSKRSRGGSKRGSLAQGSGVVQHVQPRSPSSPEELEKEERIRAGHRVSRKDPAYQTLAEVNSEWSSTTTHSAGSKPTRGTNGGTIDDVDQVEQAIRAGKRLRRMDPIADSLFQIRSDWDESKTNENGADREAPSMPKSCKTQTSTFVPRVPSKPAAVAQDTIDAS